MQFLLTLIGTVLIATLCFGEDAISSRNPVNETACKCEATACCVCKNSIVKNALSIRIMPDDTRDNDIVELKVVLVDCSNKDKELTPAGDAGPRFNSPTGPSFMPVECDDEVRKFDIHGGPKSGKYDVWIYWKKNNGSEGCSKCGEICIFDDTAQGIEDLEFATPHPNPPAGYVNLKEKGAPGCGGGSATTTIEGLPETDSEGKPRWKKVTYTPPPEAPDQNQQKFVVDYGTDELLPNQSLNPNKKGKKIGEKSNACGQKVELYCYDGEFLLFYSECEGDSVLIGKCIWTKGRNTFYAGKTKCGEKTAWNAIYLTNEDGLNNKNVVNYEYYICTKKLVRDYRHTRKGDVKKTLEETVQPWQDGGAGDFDPPAGYEP